MAKSKEEAAQVAPVEGLATQPSASLPAVGPGNMDLDSMYEEDAGAGLTGTGAGDFATPFLAILQKGSPQVSRANAKFIKGAEQGMIFNTITGELFPGDEGILLIPCGYSKVLVEWNSRDSGGGFVATHKENDEIVRTATRNERNQLVTTAGTIIVDTAYHFGLHIKNTGFPEYAVVSMYSTQLKKSRQWNTVMRAIMKKAPSGRIFNPPTYSHMYRLKTIGEAKDNYDWYGWSILSEGAVTDVEIYKMAREFSRLVEAGAVRVSAPPRDADEAADPESVPF